MESCYNSERCLCFYRLSRRFNISKDPKTFRNIKGGLIPYTTTPDKESWDRSRHGFDDVYIIAAGRREQINPQINSMLDMALVWDSKANIII